MIAEAQPGGSPEPGTPTGSEFEPQVEALQPPRDRALESSLKLIEADVEAITNEETMMPVHERIVGLTETGMLVSVHEIEEKKGWKNRKKARLSDEQRMVMHVHNLDEPEAEPTVVALELGLGDPDNGFNVVENTDGSRTIAATKWGFMVKLPAEGDSEGTVKFADASEYTKPDGGEWADVTPIEQVHAEVGSSSNEWKPDPTPDEMLVGVEPPAEAVKADIVTTESDLDKHLAPSEEEPDEGPHYHHPPRQAPRQRRGSGRRHAHRGQRGTRTRPVQEMRSKETE